MDNTIRNRIFSLIGICLIAFSVLHLSFHVPRTDFQDLIGFYAIGFLGLWITFKYSTQKDLFWILFSGFIIRFLLINVTPELSNDFYRFIWDGEMMKMGLLPYSKTPSELISSAPEIFQNAELRALYHGMGELSQENYSNYPPLNEIFFFLASKLGTTISSKIVVLRIFIILGDIGIAFVGIALLKSFKLNLKNLLLYILNPFVIMEFTVNLHFEALMMSFFLIAIYFYLMDIKVVSALFFSFSILTKVLTLIFLPLFGLKSNLKSRFVYVFLVFVFTFLFALPFFVNDGFISYHSSNLLYFQKFEFNAGLYFIFREIGWWIKGFNWILVIGPFLAFISLFSIFYLYYRNRKSEENENFRIWLLAFFIFLLMSTTVHPWYIGPLLILSVFTNYKFPVIWSFVAYFSYYFYNETMNEYIHYSLITIEYFVVVFAFYMDIKLESKNSQLKRTN